MTPRLLDRYRSDVHAKLMDEFGYRNPFQVPTLSKIVVNVGLGEAAANPKLLEFAELVWIEQVEQREQVL